MERPEERVPYLEHIPEEGQPPHRVLLRTWPYRIGRGDEAELTIFSRSVSTLHAEIVRLPTGHILRDLGSTNGTFLNGKKILEHRLNEGDVIHIAHKELRFGLVAVEDDQPEPTLAQHGTQQRLLRETSDLTQVFAKRLVRAVFQPIVRLDDRTTVGFETLGRIALPDYSIEEMLQVATQRGEAPRLCRLLREVAVEAVSGFASPRAIYFNLHPEEMDGGEALDAALRQMARVADAGHAPVLEIHENAVTDAAAMSELRARLADLDIKLAYDDFGSGQSRLMELVEVPPDTLKLDITLVRDIDGSTRRQDLVRALVQVLAGQGIEVLAEGIERQEEADVCAELGCHLGQGFFLGRPAPIEDLTA